MAASLAIHRLSARTPARAQPVAARLALQALGADLEDALPRGLPPQALLWLRRLRLQAPEAALLRPAPVAWRQEWIAAGRERLDTALAQAARPALGPVPDDAEAVLFADAAEMLACLALAARAGRLDRWWWRGLLGRTWPHWQTAWAARPQAQAAAQRLLQRAGQGRVAAFDVGPANEFVELTARAAALTTVPPLPERAAGVVGETPAESLPPALPRVAVGGPLPTLTKPLATVADAVAMAPVAAQVAPPPQAKPSVSVESTQLLQASRVEAIAPAQPPPDSRPEPAMSEALRSTRPLPPARRFVQIDARTTAEEASPSKPAVRGADAVGEPPADPRLAPIQSLQTPAQQAGVAPVEALPGLEHPASAATPAPEIAAGATRREQQPVEPFNPPAAAPRTASDSIASEGSWPWPQAVPSQQAPLLFLVNALLEDGLYPDFTRPRDPGLPVPLWALLAALARAWRLPMDPLHAALAERAGDCAAPELLPAVPGVPAGRWADWLPNYARTLRHRLCRRLGLRTAQWPRALTLAHPARLWLSEAEWVAEFDLAGHDVAWRLAGLDRDPGWLPSAGCSLRFEFI